MGMTLTEKILARGAGISSVSAGKIVTAKINRSVIQDALGPIVYRKFRKLNTNIWDTNKISLVIDHFCLPGSIENAMIIDETKRFSNDFGISDFYDMQGVSHQIIIENGRILPGEIAVGTDSHTCTYGALGAFATGIGSTEMCSVLATGELWFKVPKTIKVTVTGKLANRVMSKDIMLRLLGIIGANGATYKSLEFTGDTISELSMSSRFTLCNMAIESGAKNGIIAPDEKTEEFLGQPINMISSDQDAEYEQEIVIDASILDPQVAVPFSPANSISIKEVEGIKLDQVIIGSCTNGRSEDIKIATEIIGGKKIPPNLRCFIVPASNKVFAETSRLGYLAILAEAGCIIVNPGCGGCGIQMPLLEGETCLGTHNRNFRGRMGSPDSKVYLSSPATAAASALCGKISDPRGFSKFDDKSVEKNNGTD
ncbi:MAG: 3-isopropylmalate dehydratase large subunit [Clostridiaceae bacterium]|jgi:3-isopropylmalate/(R)-2-methylmalate dehydratase large subunit|nr:3-isopropylmalate dehydratase large subunit [Clostridiaceae bacterium]